MTASQMIGSIDSIGYKLNPIYNQMLDEMHACAVEWHELKQANKATHEEAQVLLLSVQDHVRALHSASRLIVAEMNKALYLKEDSQ